VGDTHVRILLPQQCDAQDLLLRQRDLAVQRAAFEWVHTPGLPPYCKGVPKSEEFTSRQRDRMALDVMQSILDAATASAKWIRRKPGKISDYSLFYALRRKPAVARRWEQDEEFARQRLDGINPFMISGISELPENFPVTDEALRGVLPDGITLDQLLGEGRLFVTDYAALEDAPVNIGCFLTAPINLFWVDGTGRLMPLAIQLGQSPAEAPVIFTPADPKWVWLTARTFAQEADGNHHEVIDHLTRTHLVMETFWVAASRTLPPQHPLHVLLKPHFTGTIQINDEARTIMVAPGGPIDQTMAVGSEGAFWLIAKEYERWSFSEWNPRAQLAARGVLDPDRLPEFHYRDDSIRLFDAIGTYVKELLAVFYRSNEDIAADYELQSFVAELADEGGGRVRGLPLHDGRLTTVEDLVEILQLILYLVSVEHAAVNNGQYDQFGYIPNTPGALFLPAPKDTSPINEAEFVYYLPMPEGVEAQIGMVGLLSEPTLTPLGNYDDTFFQSSAEARLAIDRFQAAIADIQIDIDRRNKLLAVPYDYLSPAQVGRSIAI
jgi:arachidonate 15-lipoxygenase